MGKQKQETKPAEETKRAERAPAAGQGEPIAKAVFIGSVLSSDDIKEFKQLTAQIAAIKRAGSLKLPHESQYQLLIDATGLASFYSPSAGRVNQSGRVGDDIESLMSGSRRLRVDELMPSHLERLQGLSRATIIERQSAAPAPNGQEYVDPYLFETGHFESREEYEELSRTAKIKPRAKA